MHTFIQVARNDKCKATNPIWEDLISHFCTNCDHNRNTDLATVNIVMYHANKISCGLGLSPKSNHKPINTKQIPSLYECPVAIASAAPICSLRTESAGRGSAVCNRHPTLTSHLISNNHTTWLYTKKAQHTQQLRFRSDVKMCVYNSHAVLTFA